jgi:Fanconi anemia group J protein
LLALRLLVYIENAYFSLVSAEPRGSQDEFEPVLKGYYDSIRLGNKPTFGRKRRVKKIELNHFNVVESPENRKKGAAFLAVCRGKVD